MLSLTHISEVVIGGKMIIWRNLGTVSSVPYSQSTGLGPRM